MQPILPALLVIAAAVALGTGPVWDYDVWFHLACGRDLVAARGIPPFDTLSFTAFDRPWDAHEWLFDVLLYGLWSVGGIGGLVAAKALAAGAFGWLLYARTVRDRPDDAGRWIAAAFVIVGLWVCRWSIVERPQMLTFAFVCFELLWLESGRSPWALVALEIPWANLHGGSALLGPGVFGLWQLGRAIAAGRTAASSIEWKPLVAMLAAVAVNPAGFGLFLYPFETMRDTVYLANVLEWMPPTVHESPEFHAWYAATVALAVVWFRRWSLAPLAVALPLALLPWTARRHIPLAVIVLTPVAARSAAAWLARPLSMRGAAPALAVVAAVVLLLGPARRHEILRGGVRDDLFPAAALPALSAARPRVAAGRPVKVYTLHRWGGFASWTLPAGFKTFIDGRQLVFGSALFAEYYRILEDAPDAAELLDRYAPDVFVLNYGTRLSRRLAGDVRFTLVHWDDTALMYLRRSACDPRWLAGREYRSFHPEVGVRGPPAGCLAELERAGREAPGHTRPLVARSQVLLALGRRVDALEAARQAVAAAPAVPAVLLGGVDAAIGAGALDLAADWIARARRAGAAAEDLGLDAGQVALARGDAAGAEREWLRAMTAAEARQIVTRTPPAPLPEIYRRLADLRRAAGDGPGAAFLLRKAGNALFTLGDLPAALAAYRGGLAAAPNDVRLRHNVGSVLFTQRRTGEAIDAFRRAVAADAAHVESWVSLGHALHAAGRDADAVAAWRRALSLDPSRADVREALATVDRPHRPANGGPAPAGAR